MQAGTHLTQCHDYCCSSLSVLKDRCADDAGDGLANEIHPLFARAKFHGSVDYEAIRPSLQLASKIMGSDAMAHYITTMVDGALLDKNSNPITIAEFEVGPTLTDEKRDARAVEDDFSFVVPISDTVDSAKRARAAYLLDHLATMVTFEIYTGTNDKALPEIEGHSDAICTVLHGPLPCDRIEEYKFGMRTLIELHAGCAYNEVVHLTKLQQRNKDEFRDCHELMMKRFAFTEALIHELGHSVQRARYNDMRGFETFFDKIPLNEGGYVLEGLIFGGIVHESRDELDEEWSPRGDGEEAVENSSELQHDNRMTLAAHNFEGTDRFENLDLDEDMDMTTDEDIDMDTDDDYQCVSGEDEDCGTDEDENMEIDESEIASIQNDATKIFGIKTMDKQQHHPPEYHQHESIETGPILILEPWPSFTTMVTYTEAGFNIGCNQKVNIALDQFKRIKVSWVTSLFSERFWAKAQHGGIRALHPETCGEWTFSIEPKPEDWKEGDELPYVEPMEYDELVELLGPKRAYERCQCTCNTSSADGSWACPAYIPPGNEAYILSTCIEGLVEGTLDVTRPHGSLMELD